ncbi:nectin-3 isoform X1 [Chanodichthys erythropterus]|uniref:nectin-3 isoform X1 n=1 Tax=Chanodichthys erythropterus TaxID=933992 RepID=UPI00351F2052
MLHCLCWNIASVTVLCLFYLTIDGVKVRPIGLDTAVIYGENATLLCHLTKTDESLTRILWKKKTQENPEDKIFFVIHPDGTTEQSNGLGDRIQFIGNFAEKNGSIQLLRMRFLDEGIYTCIFNLIYSGPLTTDINVTVYAHPVVNVKGEAPVAGHLEAMLASCFASNALPAAAVMWRLGDLENFLRTETNHTVHPDGTITVVSYLLGVPFKHLNKKNVQCVVKHKTLREDLVMNYTINIDYPPGSVVIIPYSAANVKEFKCIVDSNPEPTNYTWTRVNKSTPYYEGNKLPVPKLSPDFNGLYICQASNQYGSSSGSLYVNVHTESSTVCWGLFGFYNCAVLGVIVGAVIFKKKPEWIPVSLRNNDEGAQDSGEL